MAVDIANVTGIHPVLHNGSGRSLFVVLLLLQSTPAGKTEEQSLWIPRW
jgi:hypothetical protein